jgi:hypothetical protein
MKSGAMYAAALCVCRPLATWLFPLREGFFLPQLHQGSSLREASSNLLNMNMGDEGTFGIELLNSILNAGKAPTRTKEYRLSAMMTSLRHANYWPLGELKSDD